MWNKKHFYNTDYFNVIDCEDKAYFLGLLYADGYSIDHISTEGFGITLQKQDNDILLKLKECINSDYPLNCATVEYSGRGNIKKFYDYIYYDATIYLTRKK